MYQELLSIKIFLTLLILSFNLYGESITQAERESLIKRGSKIFSLLCNAKVSLEDFNKSIKKECQELESEDILALKLYLKSKSSKTPLLPEIKPIPKSAKCLVCGMLVRLYPDWACVVEVGKKRLYFDGVKDMMRFYLSLDRYHFKRENISKILVQDFYTLKPIDAKKALYVVGSNIKGPMGWDFIPFGELKYAKIFLNDHKGREIIKFDDITPKLIERVQKNEF
jgi:nitrous oxide reductase accessory protein NosL